MTKAKFVSYLRVSTDRQGNSGLGIEAQRGAVLRYLNGGSWTLAAEVVEIESGKRSDRPKLGEALRLCRLHGATLVIAKLDRLARNVHFVSSLMEFWRGLRRGRFPASEPTDDSHPRGRRRARSQVHFGANQGRARGREGARHGAGRIPRRADRRRRPGEVRRHPACNREGTRG